MWCAAGVVCEIVFVLLRMFVYVVTCLCVVYDGSWGVVGCRCYCCRVFD